MSDIAAKQVQNETKRQNRRQSVVVDRQQLYCAVHPTASVTKQYNLLPAKAEK